MCGFFYSRIAHHNIPKQSKYGAFLAVVVGFCCRRLIVESVAACHDTLCIGSTDSQKKNGPLSENFQLLQNIAQNIHQPPVRCRQPLIHTYSRPHANGSNRFFYGYYLMFLLLVCCLGTQFLCAHSFHAACSRPYCGPIRSFFTSLCVFIFIV